MTTLTMLSDMAGSDFATGLINQHNHSIFMLDLKGGIFGKALLSLTDDEAEKANGLIKDTGMMNYVF